jgi:hypothetical protein
MLTSVPVSPAITWPSGTAAGRSRQVFPSVLMREFFPQSQNSPFTTLSVAAMHRADVMGAHFPEWIVGPPQPTGTVTTPFVYATDLVAQGL